MITQGRHRLLAQDAWNESAVRIAIDDIAADADCELQPRHFLAGPPK